jgi:uncharacterized protein YjiS (DUF1127 family)
MIFTMLLSKIRSWVSYRETVRELSRLSDHQLSGLGLTRNEIEFIAKKSVSNA